MNYKLTFNLIQKTPMVHFQHYQQGATLRASEVKPRFDKFLMNKMGGFDALFEVHPWWFMKYVPGANKTRVNKALNYKMRIFADSKPYISNQTEYEKEAYRRLNSPGNEKKQSTIKREIKKEYRHIHNFYFGNIVSKREGEDYIREVTKSYKETVFYNSVRVEIICFDDTLRTLIEKHFGEFILTHNFATRQTKGFGSFVCEGISKDDALAILDENKCNYFYTDISPENYRSYIDCMDAALVIYSIMKSGLNATKYDSRSGEYINKNAYIKGYAVREYLDDTTGSDKAFVKSKVLAGRPRAGKSSEPAGEYEKYVFIRAMLGLAEQYEFHDDMRRGKVFINNYEDVCFDGDRITIAKESVKNDRGIRRFQSPILIKIIDNRIIFIAKDSYKHMLDKVFFFTEDADEIKNRGEATDGERVDVSDLKYIKTPENFDMDKFIDGFIDYFEANKDKLDKYFTGASSKAAKLKLIRGGAR